MAVVVGMGGGGEEGWWWRGKQNQVLIPRMFLDKNSNNKQTNKQRKRTNKQIATTTKYQKISK